MTTPQMQNEPKPPFPKQHQSHSPGQETELSPAPRFAAPNYRPAAKLKGKKALITGGDSGIGRAVAVIYAREGADVGIVYLPEEEKDARATQKYIEDRGQKCLLLPGDVVEAEFCAEAVAKFVEHFGGLDILVNNAAHQMRKNSLEELTFAEWDKTFKTNVYAYFHFVKAAVPHMPPGSAIVVTSSETAFQGPKELPDYSATKGAINTFTKSLARMLIEKGIRVNAVAPGPVWTPLNPADQGQSAAKVSSFGSSQPIGRPAQPEELAPAYVFLASDADASYITGIILPVMGGLPV